MICFKCKQEKKPDEIYSTYNRLSKICLKCKAEQRIARVATKHERQALFLEKYRKVVFG